MGGFISFRFVSVLLRLVSFYAGTVKAELGDATTTGLRGRMNGFVAGCGVSSSNVMPVETGIHHFSWIPASAGIQESRRASGK